MTGAGVVLTVEGLTVEGGHVALDRVSVALPADVRAQLARLGPAAGIVEAYIGEVADCAVWLGASDAVALVTGSAAPYRRTRAGFRPRPGAG